MTRISLNARLANKTAHDDQVQVVLFEFTHPELDAPVRLSTDNTERLSIQPVSYGTRSSWRGANPVTEPFLWIIASWTLPSDQPDAPAFATITLEQIDRRIGDVLQSFYDLATVSMAVVLASSPDVVEVEYTDLRLIEATIKDGSIELAISREEIELEFFPAGRMSPAKFPGLNK
ncbi:hypothetical protein [uncultured Tateyamaria sp.]|uniref:hypothetical protein n=1 Tax=uncultured Tateyamaria sp. TaxID=455651 RepID=UPI002627E896|nr:hypothetical protein [uncultured Tateyamaria sp.]